MAGSRHQHVDRWLISAIHHIRRAADAEASALGRPEVYVEHLLVGLLVVGGPSARALAGAGADLPAVRRAVAQVQEQGLSAPGIPAVPWPAEEHAADRNARTAVPLRARARDLLDAAPWRGDDRRLLTALLDDDDRRVRRVLEHAGVDVDDLREHLRRGREPASAVPEGSAAQDHAAVRGPAPAGSTWMDAAYSQVLPVPADRVWALVSDPLRRTQWDPTRTAATVTAEGLEQLTGLNERTVIQEVVQFEPGRAIAWREHQEGTGPAAEQFRRLVLHPSGNTTGVHLHQSWPARGAGVRLTRPLLVQMVRTRLRVQVHGIAQSA